MKFISYRKEETGFILNLGESKTCSQAVNCLMLDLFALLGDGDNENEGKGSLWNCAPEIHSILMEGKTYSYANTEWFVKKLDI